MNATQKGEHAANQGHARPASGSDKPSQEKQKGYDKQKAKNDSNKK